MKKIILIVIALSLVINVNSFGGVSLASIRIDQYNRIWWNSRVVTPNNLPELVSNKLSDSMLQNDYFVYEKLSNLVVEHLKNRSPLLRIIVHPKSHYMIFNNIIFMYNKIELEMNKKIVLKKNLDIDSISRYNKHLVRYVIYEWGERDDKIMQVVCDKLEIIQNDTTICNLEWQYGYKLNAGYWKEIIDEAKYYIYDSNSIMQPKVPNPNADIDALY